MAAVSIVWPETSPVPLYYYELAPGGAIAPVSAMAYMAADLAVPVTAAAPLPVTISGSGGGTTNVQGNVAAGAVNTGNPLGSGAAAYNPDTPLPAVDAGDRQWIMCDLNGRPVTYLGTCLDSVNDSIACLGNVAHDAVDSGNPVKIGGYASSTAPTAVAIGDRVNAWYTLTGRACVSLVANSGEADGLMAGPPLAETGNIRNLLVAPSLYNPAATTWDRQRANHEVTALASAARTTTTNSSDLTNYNAKGVVVTIDCTANASTAGVTVSIAYKCTLSGKYVTLLTSATLFGSSATGTSSLYLYPGQTVAANVSVSTPLPRVWRVTVTHGDGSSITYSVSANYIN